METILHESCSVLVGSCSHVHRIFPNAIRAPDAQTDRARADRCATAVLWQRTTQVIWNVSPKIRVFAIMRSVTLISGTWMAPLTPVVCRLLRELATMAEGGARQRICQGRAFRFLS